MSIVVSLKYDNGVVIAADKQATDDFDMKGTCTKLKKYNLSNTAIGGSGTLVDIQSFVYLDEVIPYEDILKKVEIDDKYVFNTLVPKVETNLKNRDLIRKRSDGLKYFESTLTFATSNRIFTIYSDFSFAEHDLFSANGHGEFAVIGYLNVVLEDKEYKDINKEEAIDIIKNAIKKSCSNDTTIGMGIDLCVLEKSEEIK